MKRIISLFRPDPPMQFHFGRAIVAIIVAGMVGAAIFLIFGAFTRNAPRNPIFSTWFAFSVVGICFIAVSTTIPWTILHFFRLTGPLTAAISGLGFAGIINSFSPEGLVDPTVTYAMGLSTGLVLWRITYRANHPKIDPSVF